MPGMPTRSDEIGATSDAPASDSASQWTVISLLKGLFDRAAFAARSTAPSAVSNGAAVSGVADLMGRQIVQLGSIPELQYNYAGAVANTTEANFAVGSSGVRLGLHTLNIMNLDTVSHTFKLRSTTGAAVYDKYVQVDAGKSVDLSWPQGLWANVSSNWSVQMGEAVTTTSPYLTAKLYRIAGA